ncbi:type VII secretion system-associated protein [Streptomyces sp. D2-8]|uniref:type VII secretion system-associated protein n=1 Tax=Streptomyces sp. D2-8 TaxID=2707767 RepID=UPI0020BD87E6|nr:type VII secretion system-associated protein [Streptomyces sp. D2-8]MCK8435480.1 type VII secretion system-associated protein [Streptomyces sp. D2-8]
MRPGERQEGRHGARPAEPSVTDADEPTGDPEVPEAVRAAARRAPGHWIGMADPEWTEERTPPEWAVLGEWRSDEGGDVGEYRANPAYRPSPRMLGWPEATDPVDAAAQRAATGYGSVDEAVAALAEAEVMLVRGTDGGPLTAAGRDGAPVVLLFTSAAHAFMSEALRHDTLPARELARSLSGADTLLMVNAGAAAPLLVPADRLLGPVRAEGDEGERAGGPAGTVSADRTDSSPEPRPHTAGRSL